MAKSAIQEKIMQKVKAVKKATAATPTKATAKPAAKTTAKPAAKTTAKPAAKTTAKPKAATPATVYQAPKPYTAPTYTAPKYTAPAYDEKKYRNGIDTSYYTNAVKNYTTQANKDRAAQVGEAQRQQDSSLKQAYLTKVQTQKALNDSMAVAGIRGGATETSNLKVNNQYATDRSAANATYANSVNQINQAIDQNIANYRSDMESRAEEYRQNLAQAKWQAAREDANNQWQAAREDATNKWNATREDVINKWQAARDDATNKWQAAREDANNKWQAAREDKQTERNANIEYWSNYYLDYYSGAKKSTLDKALKTAQENLKKAKTASERLRIQMQIRGIQNRRGVLANSK